MTWSATVALVGTKDSPEVINTLSGFSGYEKNFSTIVVPGETGYYYSYVAEVDGTLSLYLDENATLDPFAKYPDDNEDDPLLINAIADLKAEIVLTNSETEKTVKLSDGVKELVINRGYGSDTYKVIQIDVKAGEEVIINIISGAEGYEDGVTVVTGLILQEPYGAQGNPVKVTKNNQEITVPAGATYFVSVDQYPLMEYAFTITGETAALYDFYGEAIEGTEDILLSPAYVGWDTYYMFQIKNTGDAEATYKISFDMELGLELNPEIISDGDSKEVTFEVGNYNYYYYLFTAEKNGIFSVTVDSNEEWTYIVSSSRTDAGGFVNSKSEEIKHIVIDVKAGDEIKIGVTGMDYDQFDVLAETTVVTTVNFTESEGDVVDKDVVSAIVGSGWEGTGILGGEFDETGIIEIDMENEDGSKATIIPAEILKAIYDYNYSLVNDYEEEPIDFTLVLNMGYYTWEISNITGTTPIDLNVQFSETTIDDDVLKSFADGNDFDTFIIAHDGEFPFDAILTTRIPEEYAGYTAALYWYNDGEFELVGEKFTVFEDGIINLNMTHASEYVLIIEGTADPIPGTGDVSTTGYVVMITIFAAAVFMVTRKKFAVEE